MKRSPTSKTTARKRQKRTLRRSSKLACFVYGLKDETGALRYVGQTRLPLQDRLRWHHRNAGPVGSPVERWLENARPEIVMLDGAATWDVSEILWIERLRTAGEPLLNVTRGGRDSLHEARRAA